MTSIPVPDERTDYSSRRPDDVDALAWPVFSPAALHDVGAELDVKGCVVTHDGFVTSVPGLFAVGAVRAGSVKRVASAVGEGSVVISAVHTYLGQHEQPKD